VNFCDLDVLAAGPVVDEVSRFDDYWNSEWAVPIGAFAAPPAPGQLINLRRPKPAAGAFATVYARMLEQGNLAARLASGSFLADGAGSDL
jgi:putative cardiolipin synthase